MCFSASASFVLSGVLTASSLVSLKKAQPRLQLFASTPLFFALQQASEGVIWLSTPGNCAYIMATYIFLFFAAIFWPTWIPFVIMQTERSALRKKIAYVPVICGALFSCLSLYYLVTSPVIAIKAHHHIAYGGSALPLPISIGHLWYLFVAVTPCFISSLRYAWLLGVGIIGAYIISRTYFFEHFGSTWCFFAAVISSLVLFVVMTNKESK